MNARICTQTSAILNDIIIIGGNINNLEHVPIVLSKCQCWIVNCQLANAAAALSWGRSTTIRQLNGNGIVGFTEQTHLELGSSCTLLSHGALTRLGNHQSGNVVVLNRYCGRGGIGI